MSSGWSWPCPHVPQRRAGCAPGPSRGVSSQRRALPPLSGTSAAAWSFSPQSRGLWGRSRRFACTGPWGKSRPPQVGRAGSKSTGSMRRTSWIRAEPSESHVPGFRARLSPVLALRLRNPGEAHDNPDGLGVWTGTDLRHRRSPARLGTMPFPPPCVIRAGTGAELALSRAIMRVKRSACCRPRTCPATVLSDAQGPGLVSSTKDATWDTDSLSWVSEPQKS